MTFEMSLKVSLFAWSWKWGEDWNKHQIHRVFCRHALNQSCWWYNLGMMRLMWCRKSVRRGCTARQRKNGWNDHLVLHLDTLPILLVGEQPMKLSFLQCKRAERIQRQTTPLLLFSWCFDFSWSVCKGDFCFGSCFGSSSWRFQKFQKQIFMTRNIRFKPLICWLKPWCK